MRTCNSIVRDRLSSRPALAATILVLCVSACAADGEQTADADQTLSPLAAQQTGASAGSMTIKDAEGTYFAAVRTEGAGCPAGTFNTRISDDGQVFTTTFSAFDVQISEQEHAISRNCRLAINLRSPGGRTFCVQQLAYSGYALLQENVVGRQTADYYFHDQKALTESVREDLVGPTDGSFVFRDDVLPNEELWTPCDQERELFVDTSLQLENGTPGGAGYINLAAVDGSNNGNAVQLKVASHRCDMARAQGWTTGPWKGRTDVMVQGKATTTTTNNGSGISIGRTVRTGG